MTYEEALATGLPFRRPYCNWAIATGRHSRYFFSNNCHFTHEDRDHEGFWPAAASGSNDWEVLEESLETRTERLTFEEAVATGLPFRMASNYSYWATATGPDSWIFFLNKRSEDYTHSGSWSSTTQGYTNWEVLTVDPASLPTAPLPPLPTPEPMPDAAIIDLPRRRMQIAVRSVTLMPNRAFIRRTAEKIHDKRKALECLGNRRVGGYKTVGRYLGNDRRAYKASLQAKKAWEIRATHLSTGISVLVKRETTFEAYEVALQELQWEVQHYRLKQRSSIVHSRRLGHFLTKQNNNLRKNIARYKEPKDRTSHVGIEMEFMIPEENLDDLINDLVSTRLARYIELKEDGSVYDDEDSSAVGREIAFVHPVNGYSPKILKLCELLQKHDAEISSQCGLHVHLDCRQFGTTNRSRIVNNLVACQALLYNMQPESRRRGEWCKRVRSRKVNSRRRDGDRYFGINQLSLRDKQTVEIRMHSGTISGDKIIAWVDLLTAIKNAEQIPSGKRPSNARQLAKYITMLPHITRYVRERMKKFKVPPKPRLRRPFPTGYEAELWSAAQSFAAQYTNEGDSTEELIITAAPAEETG